MARLFGGDGGGMTSGPGADPPAPEGLDKAGFGGDGGGMTSGPGADPPAPDGLSFSMSPRMMWVQFNQSDATSGQAKRRLHDLDVHFISLVADPANQKQFLAKSKRADEGVVVRTIKILKANTLKKMVYGIVYAPDEVDTEGDTMTAAEIEKASYRFMQKSRVQKIDTDHSYVEGAGFVAESWLVRKGDSLFPEEPEGAWAVGIKVTDDATWDRVVKGELTGLSLAGLSKYEPLATEDETDVAKAFAERVKAHLGLQKEHAVVPAEKGSFKERLFQNQIWRVTEALGDAIRDVLRDDEITDKLTAVRAIQSEFDAYLVEQLGEATAKAEKQASAGDTVAEEAVPAEQPAHDTLAEMKALLAKQAKRIAVLEQATPGRQSVLGDEENVRKQSPGKGYKGLRITF